MVHERSSAASSIESRRLAHDLLQSLTVLRSIVSVTRTEVGPSETVADRLALVEAEAARMAETCRRHVADRVLDEPIDLGVIVRDAADRAAAVETRPIVTEVELGSGVRLLGDGTAWERALGNLLDNACRAAGPDGTVRVRASTEGSACRVAVADSGPGFGEVPGGRAALGLVSASRAADQHGGHLEIRRSDLGGAEVSIVVPAADPT